MLIGRHSFIRQSKLSDVAGRIDYISNPKRQEYLYETYQTEGATPEFWKNLARENQLDFKARGTAGKCIEGREFIIAFPESFVRYRADDVVMVMVKLENIADDLKDIKRESRENREEMKTLRERVVIVEQSLKSYHKRLDGEQHSDR